jgi:hypothetical protein
MDFLKRIFFTLAAACIVSAVDATTLVPPLGQPSGSWLGATQGNAEYFRVEIDETGRGFLTVKYQLAQVADAYEILSTSLDGYSISLALLPIGGAEPVFAQGSADKMGLSLNIGGTESKWIRTVFLEPESEVLGRINAVTRPAQEFKMHRSAGVER